MFKPSIPCTHPNTAILKGLVNSDSVPYAQIALCRFLFWANVRDKWFGCYETVLVPVQPRKVCGLLLVSCQENLCQNVFSLRLYSLIKHRLSLETKRWQAVALPCLLSVSNEFPFLYYPQMPPKRRLSSLSSSREAELGTSIYKSTSESIKTKFSG